MSYLFGNHSAKTSFCRYHDQGLFRPHRQRSISRVGTFLFTFDCLFHKANSPPTLIRWTQLYVQTLVEQSLHRTLTLPHGCQRPNTHQTIVTMCIWLIRIWADMVPVQLNPQISRSNLINHVWSAGHQLISERWTRTDSSSSWPIITSWASLQVSS